MKNADLDALSLHPCYCEKASCTYARVHLPVAPRCNVQCKYCNRRYDCLNESRPGVTSEILTPDQAVERVKLVKAKIPNLTVVGIAGPGDPLANDETFETLRKIRREFPELTVCLSTNGLALSDKIDELVSLGIKFITITINAIDPKIGKNIYSWIILNGKRYEGEEAAKILISRQLQGLKKATEQGICVKVNIVMIPGINAEHIPSIVKKVKALGAYIVNILPFIPVPGAELKARSPTPRERKALQDLCGKDIRQLRHCRFCRADAVGLLGEDRFAEFANVTCKPILTKDVLKTMERKKEFLIAVATSGSGQVDLHFGHAEEFHVYRVLKDKIEFVEKRNVHAYCETSVSCGLHDEKILGTIKTLRDCNAVIAERFGYRPMHELEKAGIKPYQLHGKVEDALQKVAEELDKSTTHVH
ncbi:MAG: nitrogenase cofactor biosynthesis protein NifB [Candidatus Bathyarchaeia archaeon]